MIPHRQKKTVATATDKGELTVDMTILQRTALFTGLQQEEIARVLRCAGGYVRLWPRGAQLHHAGDRVHQLGIVLRGVVDAVEYSHDGAETMVARHGAGELFGDLLMASGSPSPVTLEAREETETLYLPLEGLFPPEGEVDSALRRVQRNLLQETTEKYWQQRRRITYLLQPRLQQRIILFLEDICPTAGQWYTVPFSRQHMAQFLGADRSALSRVLSQMKKSGQIDYRGREFLRC